MDLVLRRKAILAEVMAVQRDTVISESNKSLEPKMTELKILRTQIAQKVLAGPESEDLENHEKTLADWVKRKEGLEEEIVRSMPELRSKISEIHVCCKSVAEALPEGAIFDGFFPAPSF